MKENTHTHSTQIENTITLAWTGCVSYQGLLCFFQPVISHSLDTRLFVVHWNVRLITRSLQCIFGSKVQNEGRPVAIVSWYWREIVKLLWNILYKCVWVQYVWVTGCVCVCVCVCVGVNTRSWMLIFIYKGAYCNFSLWGFYDTVWQCFLAKLVAARHVFYYSLELCAHSWFLVSKWSFGENYVYCAFYWTVILTDFIPDLNKQKPTKRIFWIVLHKWAGILTASGLTICRFSPSAHRNCLEIMQFPGPHT